jgi:hypothetical protein
LVPCIPDSNTFWKVYNYLVLISTQVLPGSQGPQVCRGLSQFPIVLRNPLLVPPTLGFLKQSEIDFGHSQYVSEDYWNRLNKKLHRLSRCRIRLDHFCLVEGIECVAARELLSPTSFSHVSTVSFFAPSRRHSSLCVLLPLHHTLSTHTDSRNDACPDSPLSQLYSRQSPSSTMPDALLKMLLVNPLGPVAPLGNKLLVQVGGSDFK